MYVLGFERELRLAARDIQALWSRGWWVRSRYNKREVCIDIYKPMFGTVLARIYIHGECCTPSSARIGIESLKEVEIRGILTHRLTVQPPKHPLDLTFFDTIAAARPPWRQETDPKEEGFFEYG